MNDLSGLLPNFNNQFFFVRRSCYLKNERQLKYFTGYNRNNCEHECLTNLTLTLCGCVQFYMVRSKETRICGTLDENCYLEVEEKFLDLRQSCACYDPCEYTKYDIQVV